MKTLVSVCVCVYIWVSPRKFSKNDKTIQMCFGLFINNHNITKDDSKILNIPLNSIFALYYYTTYSAPHPGGGNAMTNDIITFLFKICIL